MTAESHCPLCGARDNRFFCKDRRRAYLRCHDCALVFVPPEYFLSRAAERAEYDLHENSLDDPGYRGFLSRLAQPLLQRLPDGARGLDFGCGPAPALARMLREAGCEVALYDSFYLPDAQVLQPAYDFVCATEVVEHLHHPGAQLEVLWSLLGAGGWLGIMTKLARDVDAFSRWHYKNDPTHVCFFSVETWQWWARQMDAQLEILGADVILLQKP